MDWMKSAMGEKYELTESARPGPSSCDDKEVRVLNRIVRWTSEGVEYEADPRHVEQIVRDLDLIGAKPVTTPGLKPTFEQPRRTRASTLRDLCSCSLPPGL